MKKEIKTLLGFGAVGMAVESIIAGVLFNRTMIRQNTSSKRTMDMANTDWEPYIPNIREKKEWLMTQEKREVTVLSQEGFRLSGTFFPSNDSKKTVLCLHGYSSEGLTDFPCLGAFYLELGYNLLIVDHRAHGKSEGDFIGFGCLDRYDVMKWIEYLNKELVPGGEIIIHGISMGAATALMTAGQKLPTNVKGIISDCAFTSPYDVFSHVLKTTYHMHPFPIMQIADGMARVRAGYGLRECDAKEEVKKSTVPILFIHGDADTFVPCYMCKQLYAACSTKKELLIVEGAGHAEAYHKDPEKYEKKVKNFLTGVFGE